VRDQQRHAPPADAAAVPPELLEAVARAVAAALAPPPQPAIAPDEGTADFLTTGEFARRLRLSRETVRRLAIADVLPHTVVCRGVRKTTRRFPRRFADDFAASGLDVADLAGFAARWRASVAGSR
jgi:excisionase family DNA binding protein